MDLLEFDSKYTSSRDVFVANSVVELRSALGDAAPVSASLVGRTVQIFDEAVSLKLCELAGFGQWLDDVRLETVAVNPRCFSSEKDNLVDSCQFDVPIPEDAVRWSELTPVVRILCLLPEEATFLAFDWGILTLKKQGRLLRKDEIWSKMFEFGGIDFVKKYAAYRFLKNNGWCVRHGLTFGCDYLVYRLGAQHFHASAAVLICDRIEPLELISRTRTLTNNRKSLMLAHVKFMDGVDLAQQSCVDGIEVKIVTAKTFFLDREAPKISIQPNKVY